MSYCDRGKDQLREWIEYVWRNEYDGMDARFIADLYEVAGDLLREVLDEDE